MTSAAGAISYTISSFATFPPCFVYLQRADDQWVWDLLEMAALPTEAVRLSEEEVARVLKTHHIRRFTASQVCEVLRQKRTLTTGLHRPVPARPSPGTT